MKLAPTRTDPSNRITPSADMGGHVATGNSENGPDSDAVGLLGCAVTLYLKTVCRKYCRSRM